MEHCKTVSIDANRPLLISFLTCHLPYPFPIPPPPTPPHTHNILTTALSSVVEMIMKGNETDRGFSVVRKAFVTGDGSTAIYLSGYIL
jgi:hypothetical protein